MNWKKIIGECPKILRALTEWDGGVWFIHGILKVLDSDGEHYTNFNTRNLFEFFDCKGMVIEISPSKIDGIWKYVYFITTETNWYNGSEIYLSRTLAEEAAFERAFQLLEQSLSKESGK